jgi:hypothetical protein
MNEAFRPADKAEREVINRLLEKGLPDRNDLIAQLDGLMVKSMDLEGSLSLKVNSPAVLPEFQNRIVAEGYYSDEDVSSSEGPQVHVLLHVVNGRLAELEIYKDDGTAIKKPPLAENLFFY